MALHFSFRQTVAYVSSGVIVPGGIAIVKGSVFLKKHTLVKVLKSAQMVFARMPNIMPCP